MDIKINTLDTKVCKQGAKLDRIDLTTQAIQTDVEGLHGEMKGVHKVLDHFDGRITQLEKHTGLYFP